MPVSAARWISFFIGLLGLIVCASALMMIVTQPDAVEARTQHFVVNEVEKGTRAALKETESDGLAKTAMQRLARKYDDQAFILQHGIADRVPLIVATILAERCKGDCPEADTLEDIGLSLVLGKAMELEVKGATLREFVAERYDRTISGLMLDLKIFTFVNAMAFALVLLLSAAKGQTIARPLLKLTLMIAASVLISSYFYLFGQDWFSTILLNQYVGWAYLLWMLLLLGLLIDIGFLRGMISNWIISAIGAAFSALPL